MMKQTEIMTLQYSDLVTDKFNPLLGLDIISQIDFLRQMQLKYCIHIDNPL